MILKSFPKNVSVVFVPERLNSIFDGEKLFTASMPVAVILFLLSI